MFKLMNKKRRQGQSTLEYAILIIIIIAALLSIQVYIKRGVQGRFKQAADDIGDQFSVGNTNVVHTTTTSSKTLDTFKLGVTESKQQEAEVTTEDLDSRVENKTLEFWGR
jgi:Flp pilus assembly pilin Flp